MSSTHVIRRAVQSDVKELVAFAANSFTATFGHLYPEKDLSDFIASSYTEAIFSKWLLSNSDDTSDKEALMWIAVNTSSSTVLGYILAGVPCSLPHEDVDVLQDGEIMKCYVDKSQFGTGLADRLLAEAISWLRSDQKTKNIWLGCYSENFRAQKFYTRHGFEKVGEYNYIVGSCVDLEYVYRLHGPDNAN
jgi:ribosomal protein S18 acetylase RimI-like enzyme